MSFLTTGVHEILESLDSSLLEAVEQAPCVYCYHAWLNDVTLLMLANLWSGSVELLTKMVRIFFSGTDLVYNVEENGHHMGKNRLSVLPFIFLF